MSTVAPTLCWIQPLMVCEALHAATAWLQRKGSERPARRFGAPPGHTPKGWTETKNRMVVELVVGG
jgi:hypothetical protein